MSKDPASLPYREGVGIVLFNRDGLVFAAKRIDSDAAWQMPQGGIDKGETPLQAALREMEEEIGTAKAELMAESAGWLTYDLPTELVGKVWKGRFRGQKQKWFALRFTGAESEIDVEHPDGGAHSREFATWRWEPLQNVPDLVVPFKRAVYDRVVHEFLPLTK